ncbi:MAG: hypothetical protein FJ202_06740 [Gemmatimonadetes bacterium]|nr:hypothetical protein [Gemmatimonadota bacterium]
MDTTPIQPTAAQRAALQAAGRAVRVDTTPIQPTAAQRAALQATGRAVTNEQISTAIRNSGLNQQQIQQQLRSAGYDPSLADPYFVQGASGLGVAQRAPASGAATNIFVQALQTLGILTVPTTATTPEETPQGSPDAASGRAGGIFGKEIFNRAATVFDPVTAGPVDPGYRLGIGDQLQLVVTGQVELAYAIEVRRDGTVIVPQVGQIALAGLTLDAARGLMQQRMSRSYSGLTSGEARLDLSIARIRANAVFVLGEVEAPGALQVNGLATVFHALARAGGPTVQGSFRNVEVRRANRVVQRLDLYDYLLRGDATGDIRLEQGDQIYVPLSRRVVEVIGQVRRPRVFELRDNEGFSDLLGFAGGLTPVASAERVQIDRIVPAERRSPGFDRVKVDVEIRGSLGALARVPLLDGDIVQVFGIGDLRRNVVSVTGQVFQPGEFELRPAMTLGQLIDSAEGMLPWALSDRVKVVRQVPLTGRTIVHNVDASTAPGRVFLLEEFDAVEVLDSRVGYPRGTISVDGAVNAPSTRPFAERETLRDAIERSGGLKEDAEKIEVYRRRAGSIYSDTTSIRFSFRIGPNFVRDTSLRDFVLERDDRVIVLSSPGYRAQQFVTVGGQFSYPGPYAIAENSDRVRDVILRAGGALPGAFDQSFRLIRNGRDVSIDFPRVMRSDSAHNIPLLGGDSLVIYRNPNTVLVIGAVGRPSLIKFNSSMTLWDYVELAGGPTERGDVNKAVVQLPSGVAKRVKRVAFLFHAAPTLVSGAIISVPEKAEATTPRSEVWQRILATSSTLASLALAYAAVTR